MFLTYQTFDLLDDILIADLEAEKMHDLMMRITEGGGTGEERRSTAGLHRLNSKKKKKEQTAPIRHLTTDERLEPAVDRAIWIDQGRWLERMEEEN